MKSRVLNQGMEQRRRSRHAGDLAVTDQLNHSPCIKHCHGVCLGTDKQAREPAGFITEAVKERVDDEVTIAFVEPEYLGE